MLSVQRIVTCNTKLALYEQAGTQVQQETQHLHQMQAREAFSPMGRGPEEARPSSLGKVYQRLHSGPL